jgi:glucuronate isomerase
MTAPDVFDDDFLLESPLARELYHRYAEPEPIIDYHSHLSPHELATNRAYSSISELWLANDPTKWRALRANGVGDRFLTGEASEFEKFEAWARTVPKALGSHLHLLTHLELGRFLQIRRYLDAGSARDIFDAAKRALGAELYRARGLLERARVIVVCTTDDPADSLEHHVAHARSKGAETLRIYPTFRPDAALAVEHPTRFRAWLERLGASVGASVRSYDQLLSALEKRHSYFHQAGCRLSDHGLERAHADDYSLTDARFAFERASNGTPVTGDEASRYQSALLHELALLDHRRGWVQQFHLGTRRDANTRLSEAFGAGRGFDALSDEPQVGPLVRFLDALDRKGQLARTIVYAENPAHAPLFTSVLAAFQDGSVPGKLQLGSAWSLHAPGSALRCELEALAGAGVLARSVGTVSAAHSVLSVSRHEYFRRVLCDLLATGAERGLFPADELLLGDLVQNLCFRNARDYFRLELPRAEGAPRSAPSARSGAF